MKMRAKLGSRFSCRLASLFFLENIPLEIHDSLASVVQCFTYSSNHIPADVFRFLQEFFLSHPEYANNPFYVFGESYGGHYAPAVTHRVWQGNK